MTIAGPGSGKTRVVVARAWHLVRELGVDPARIIIIAFTNKAANEVKERLAAVGVGGGDTGAGHGGCEVLVKTFHALGAYFLRKAAATTPGLGLGSRFKVLNAEESECLMQRAVEEVERDFEGDQTPTGQRGDAERKDEPSTAGGDDPATRGAAAPLTASDVKDLVELLAYLFPRVKSRLADISFYDEDRAIEQAVQAGVATGKRLEAKPRPPARTRRESPAVAARWYLGRVQEYFSMYQRLLYDNNAVDFSDLICLPVRALDTCPELAEAWRARFDHILVDEFQDTDPAQYRFVRQLKGPGTALFVVGDPDQAIYSWRGAEVNNMSLYLPRDFPDTETKTLSINYSGHRTRTHNWRTATM
ncbi:hypothetical protein GPECTOR_25g410 [Gonium pectorale]|uniref:UvrD-like helicase ATP-binding domain-containing protein n=1 Tax=Gonium pectorale TaxID=33097 RepID=A0A150GGR9_GONPE|nr:hypothetical protein GPECTOR_25g410 [Gonium pectorale]|eukprot:KXZ48825.1 hypothetical protein GPECTOR_25g410 [Gonium pectorale]